MTEFNSINNKLELSIDEKMMQIAIEQAVLAKEKGEVPVGAVLVSENNEIIAKSHNQPISQNNPTAHCEILVLQQAGQKLNNYRMPNTTLYVTLEPCPMCAGALVHARVSKVVFAAKDFRTGACGTVLGLHQHKSLNHHLEAAFIENKEYIAILKSFFKERRK